VSEVASLAEPDGHRAAPAIRATEGMRLVVDDLSVAFGGNQVVRGASIAVAAGEIVALVGPNGAGKTTLLNAMTGLVPSSSGSMRLEGVEMLGAPPERLARAGVGRAFQEGQLFESLTVEEHLLGGYGLSSVATAFGELFGRRSALRARAEARSTADAVARRLVLDPWFRVEARHLSTGNRKLLDLGRAIVARPRVLLLDEPTAGLVPHARQRIGELLRSLAEEGCSVVVVEHDLRFVGDHCDFIYVMNFGDVIAGGGSRAVFDDPLVRSAYLGVGPGSAVPLGSIDPDL
jgi:ABC-type branched-subunit amino acid transport system ATPase component